MGVVAEDLACRSSVERVLYCSSYCSASSSLLNPFLRGLLALGLGSVFFCYSNAVNLSDIFGLVVMDGAG